MRRAGCRRKIRGAGRLRDDLRLREALPVIIFSMPELSPCRTMRGGHPFPGRLPSINSPTYGTHMKEIGVILHNLGGPTSLDAIRPFLTNLFLDPEIIRIPLPGIIGRLFPRRLFAEFVARRRTPQVTPNYQAIGGKSPLLERTEEQARALEAELNRAVLLRLEQNAAKSIPFPAGARLRIHVLRDGPETRLLGTVEDRRGRTLAELQAGYFGESAP